MTPDQAKQELQRAIREEITTQTDEAAQLIGEILGKNDPDQKNPQKQLSNKLTTNQLRRFFGEVKRQQMREYNQSDFTLLKPKLAYALARARQKDKMTKMKMFFDVITTMMSAVNDERTFKNFIKVFEALVAYHKKSEVEHS